MDGTDESEAKGILFCQSLYGADTRWIQTSYNGNFRKHYAGVGYTYDQVADEFVPPPVEVSPEAAAFNAFIEERIGIIPNDLSPEVP
jgi:hypothetical protein